MAWGEALRTAREARGQLRLRFAAGAAGIAALLVTVIVPPVPRLIWNASASAPRGLYVVSPGGRIVVGDMVVARTPEPWRSLAARRHYLPANVPLVKRAVAVAGDEICARGASLSVNGVPAVTRLGRDAEGRTLPWWEGCVAVRKGEVFLLMAGAPASFDGRYFGVTQARDIVGRAHLLWAR
ncbi:S26 family signal peptidase [Sphingopyxis sp. KK2]|uniref:S26 family signal peptidase n=1 Tax=Sphingopyxis sp. KK2 TaxID=1855727 RepID=UPI00097E5E46|nr:S26 family signal peptidase [Sphingopyxis sp. KK2]